MRPIAACAMVVVERTRVSQVTPEITQHSPRNGFNGFLRALPGHRAFLPPSPADLHPQTCHQRRGVRTPRLLRPPQRPSSESASASTASRPAFVTLRNAPLWDRTARVINLICPTPKAKY